MGFEMVDFRVEVFGPAEEASIIIRVELHLASNREPKCDKSTLLLQYSFHGCSTLFRVAQVVTLFSYALNPRFRQIASFVQSFNY